MIQLAAKDLSVCVYKSRNIENKCYDLLDGVLKYIDEHPPSTIGEAMNYHVQINTFIVDCGSINHLYMHGVNMRAELLC